MRRLSNQTLFFISVGIILFVIITMIAILMLGTESPPQTTPQPTAGSPTRSITVIPTESQTSTNPAVPYSPEETQRMLDKLRDRPPLSSNDALAKEKILTLLPVGQISGVIYRSPTVIIDYTNTADQFQGEITTVDIAQAKRDAVAWFQSQGLSQKAICDLPVVFYLNLRVANQLRNQGITFSPLAEGC